MSDQDTSPKNHNPKHRTHSLSGALSISLGLSSSYGNTYDSNQYIGRSFIGSFKQKSQLQPNESSILNNNNSLHEQTAIIANDDDLYLGDENYHYDDNTTHNYDDDHDHDDAVFSDHVIDDGANETTSLLTQQYNHLQQYTEPSQHGYYYDQLPDDLESQFKQHNHPLGSPKKNMNDGFKIQDLKPLKLIGYLPSVILGLLLNILYGLSYGMIIFPIGEKIFSNLGSAGLSMFYISCIVSQLVYSLGGSAFGAGIGSEMIEVTPFFHAMALNIMREIGEDYPNKIISTTITTYAISSIITGLIFLLLGKFKLGQLVGFFPRHILIGCIGGVGYFLIITGLEISSQLGSFEYNLNYLLQLINGETFIKIITPILLTIGLVILQHFNHNSLILPSYFISVFIIIHILIIIIPSWDLPSSRDHGFMFSSGNNGNNGNNESWYEFYKLYDFQNVEWLIILKQIPSMLALTFFGILHVPINVPALAVSTKQDNVDVDRELIAHGFSNLISGGIGSIQNYLVYTNSLLFIRAGADSRIAGIMLAFATFIILIIGPVVINFIPVCVVGSLIFLLGYELLKEAIFDIWNKVSKFEYLTILIIVLTMGIYDFVFGILIGIIIASFHFLYENTKIPIIYNQFTGEVVRSTVIRHPYQKQFLNKIGKQIYVLKLQSFLFFGTIGKIEKTIRNLFDEENLIKNPIRYLILDFKNVLNIDFSAAEGLNRIKNFIIEQNAYLIISIGDKDQILTSLKNVGLFNHDYESMITKLQVFQDLNSSLEWCENEFLTKFKQYQKYKKIEAQALISAANSNTNSNTNPNSSITMKSPNNQLQTIPKIYSALPINTPRNNNFIEEAQRFLRKGSINKQVTQSPSVVPGSSSSTTATTTNTTNLDPSQLQEPLPLLLFAFQGYSNKEPSYWKKLAPFFEKRLILKDEEIKIPLKDSFFLLVESGILKVTYYINENANIYETLLPRTLIGRFNDEIIRKDRYKSVIKAKIESSIWVLNDSKLNNLKQNKIELYNELLLIVVKLNEERFESITGYTLMSV